MNGFGFFIWPDGRIYEGEWFRNKKSGHGKYFWPNGQVYEGDFRDDQCNGVGTLFYPDGKRFQGNWKEGEKHGPGEVIFPDGSNYKSLYRNGKKVSQGRLINQNLGDDLDAKEQKTRHRSLSKQTAEKEDFLKKMKIEKKFNIKGTAPQISPLNLNNLNTIT